MNDRTLIGSLVNQVERLTEENKQLTKNGLWKRIAELERENNELKIRMIQLTGKSVGANNG